MGKDNLEEYSVSGIIAVRDFNQLLSIENPLPNVIYKVCDDPITVNDIPGVLNGHYESSKSPKKFKPLTDIDLNC